MPPAHAVKPLTPAAHLASSVATPVRWALDRILSVGYGLLYDSIVEHFAPCQALEHEVLSLVEGAAPEPAARRGYRVLDIGCGPGTFAVIMAEAGFSVLGIDSYTVLLELAREKRTAKALPNLAFARADLADAHDLAEETFDQVVSIHSLYLHETPDRVLRGAFRVLKPGGHAVFVNPTRRLAAWPALRGAWRSRQAGQGVGRLLWLLPHTAFEAMRKPVGPHYWDEAEFGQRVHDAGFAVLATRRTFLDDASVLVWARKGIES